jgi:protein-L-isoaspartate(D-aspartate) O-methyltransferase
VPAAITELPRALFVPTELAVGAYLDKPVRISHKQVTTQPSQVAKMVKALALQDEENVLEVGTGYGYQTALLAMLPRKVWSIELWHGMTDAARAAHLEVGIGDATLLVGDGTRGLPDQAPFDAIIVTAAYPTVPPASIPTHRGRLPRAADRPRRPRRHAAVRKARRGPRGETQHHRRALRAALRRARLCARRRTG